MLEEEQVAFFLASRLITRGNKGTLLLTIMIIAMVFVNLIFLPSIIAGIVVLFNQQTYRLQLREPGHRATGEPARSSPMSPSSSRRSTGFPGLSPGTPRYTGAATIVSKGKSTTPLLIAINPDDEKQVLKIHTKIISGDYLNDGDTGQIMIGTTLAGNKDQKVDSTPTLGGVDVGKTVEVTFRNGVTRQYRIKGIIDSGQFSVDSSAFITRKELESVTGYN